ncbi:cyclic nucleotide gated channel 5 [Striga asiatica]|uniref:Cyclic nucleotide gated channel 5 n=1 Tax=Striga asiatica TaxID=4170 RepID=A0A5A7Q830_STRAF|nr:cyclic nucleotide gated channel 5 [Striga asiatica]
MEGVQDAVKDGWQVEVEGSAMYQVHQKVKHTRMSLLAWHKPVHRNSEKVISTLTAKLEELRLVGKDRDWEEWSAFLLQRGLVGKQVNLVIRNGQSTRLNEVNWVPGLSGKKPELRTEVDGRLFWVKDLMWQVLFNGILI